MNILENIINEEINNTYNDMYVDIITKTSKQNQYILFSAANIIFHGGAQTITKFDPKFIEGGNRAIYGWGVYFSSTPWKASDYGNEMTYLSLDNMNILELSSRIDNTFISKLEELYEHEQENDNGSYIIAPHEYYRMYLSKFKENVGKELNDIRLQILGNSHQSHDKLMSNMFVKMGYDLSTWQNYEYVLYNFDKGNQNIITNPIEFTANKIQSGDDNVIIKYNEIFNK